MVRLPLGPHEKQRGAALGVLLREARGERSVREVASCAGLAEETLRKIERGAVPTPNLFAIAALAQVLDVELAHLVRESTRQTAGPAGQGQKCSFTTLASSAGVVEVESSSTS